VGDIVLKKLNNMFLGTGLGIFIPLLALFIYVHVKFDDLTMLEFMRSYFKMGILTHMLSLAVIPNLALFFLFIQTNRLRSARGVLLATFLFAFTVLIIRFI